MQDWWPVDETQGLKNMGLPLLGSRQVLSTSEYMAACIPVSIPMDTQQLPSVLLYPLQGRIISHSELCATIAKGYSTMTGLVKSMSTLSIPPTHYQRG